MVAASAAARLQKTGSPSSGPSCLLIVDRTFVNLEAVAQRMLGGWIAYAMRAFLVGWDSNVVKNYIKVDHGLAGWRKVRRNEEQRVAGAKDNQSGATITPPYHLSA